MKKYMLKRGIPLLLVVLMLSFPAVAFAGSYTSYINIKSSVHTNQNIVVSSTGKIIVNLSAAVHTTLDGDVLSTSPQTLKISIYDEYTGSFVDSETYGPSTSFQINETFYGLSTAHTYEVYFYNLTGTGYVHGPFSLSF